MSILRQIFETLREYYAAKSDYQWWDKNPIEVILGAILVQGSTWKQVDKVLDEFRAKELLLPHQKNTLSKIALQTEKELAILIRPVGFQTKKASRIRAVAQLILERSEGDLDCYFARDVDLIRQELLSISGIGQGTADNILLYAGQVPVYMVDTFTSRVLIRHGIVSVHENESQIQELIHRELTPDEEPYGAKLFQKMQELLVRLGRDFCDKSRPDCFHCPLNVYLPEGGAVGLVSNSQKKNQKKKPPPLPRPTPQVTTPTSPPVEGGRFMRQNTGVAAPAPACDTSLLDLNETERKVAEAIGEESMPIDEVVLAVQLPVHIVRATIAVLQMKKVVCQVGGNQVRRM